LATATQFCSGSPTEAKQPQEAFCPDQAAKVWTTGSHLPAAFLATLPRQAHVGLPVRRMGLAGAGSSSVLGASTLADPRARTFPRKSQFNHDLDSDKRHWLTQPPSFVRSEVELKQSAPKTTNNLSLVCLGLHNLDPNPHLAESW